MNDNINRLKGAKDLVFDAVEETTNLVERMHALAAKKSTQPLALIEPLNTLTRGVKTVHDSIASGVYGMVRIVNRGLKICWMPEPDWWQIPWPVHRKTYAMKTRIRQPAPYLKMLVMLPAKHPVAFPAGI